jgi:putative FmdB family regulatory protein
MPMYEFSCETCQHQFETLIRNAREEQEVRCPECQSERTHKLISLPSKPTAATVGGNPCGEGPPCGAPWCGRQG